MVRTVIIGGAHYSRGNNWLSMDGAMGCASRKEGGHYDISRKYPHGEIRYPGVPTHARSGETQTGRTRSSAVAMAADVGLVCDGGGMGVVREINS